MTKRRATILAVLLLLPLAGYAFTSYYDGRSSGLGSWRLDAPLLKLSGRLPGMSWGQLLEVYLAKTPETGGFVRLGRETGEEPCSTLWETPFGEVWGRPRDEVLLELIAGELLIDRDYEGSRVKLRPGDVVLDVGGHLGMFTRFALQKEAGRVVVFEPDPTNVACLEKTFAEEVAAGSVILVKAAAWKERDVLKFVLPHPLNTGSGSVVTPAFGPTRERSDHWIEVPAVTLDDTVDELGLESVDFIKMDIEGAERDALAGARRTLARFAPRLAICVYHKPGDRERIPEIVLAAQPEYRLQLSETVAFFD